MKSFALGAVLFLLSTAAFAALPGVTEFKTSPEKITDAELSALLHARVAAADVVAIGESVHGSAGFLQMQTRLIRYLVLNHSLRLIVWENPAQRSLELARWVASCAAAQTRAPAPVVVLYMPTAADVPLWDWVCDFNRAHPHDPIVFRGMDVWDRPWEHYALLQAAGVRAGIDPPLLKNIATVCPGRQASTWAEVEAMLEKVQRDGKFLPEADYEKCRAALTTVLDTARQAGMAKKQKKEAAADDAFEAAISASTLLGWLGFYHYERSDDILSWNERDRAQGRNLMLVMAKHGAARAILSAHTSHVSHNRSPADWWGYGDLKSGVHFFSAMTKKKVFNIALTAYEASGTQGEWSLPAAVNSLDKKLHDAGHGFSFFLSNAAFLSEHPKWWMQNGNFSGAYQSGVEFIPRDHFDAFIFLKRSRLDKALPARPMWRP
jgi:erythromycin esterase-like protein